LEQLPLSDDETPLRVVASPLGVVVPVTYRIDVARKVIRTVCSSPLTFAEVIGHFRTLQQDPECFGILDVLLDLREADLVPERGQVDAVTTELGAIRGKVHFGIFAVIAPNDAMYGMMRMFEVLASQHFRASRVFRTADEAEAWLAAQRSKSQTRNDRIA
jgi:hypothetical protein